MTQRWRCHGLRRHDKPVAAGGEGREGGREGECKELFFFSFSFLGNGGQGKIGGGGEERL